jgi:hypothetical protein
MMDPWTLAVMARVVAGDKVEVTVDPAGMALVVALVLDPVPALTIK